MQMMLTLSNPIIVGALLGLLLFLVDAFLLFIFIVIERPGLLPVDVHQHPLAPSFNAGEAAGNMCSNTLIHPSDKTASVQDKSAVRGAGAINTPFLDSEMLDNVNHEIRTPLAGIMATAQILHDEVGPHHRELTEILVASGKRMNNAINNVIELIAFKEGEYQVDRMPVQVTEEIQSMAAQYQKQAQAKGISLDIDPVQKEFILNTDPQLLRKVLNHLIDNAIKFTEQGSVKLTVKKDKNWLHVEIKDTGVGISKAFLPDIYKPFTQGSQGLSRSHNGQGIGLALTKRMIDLAGGKISIQSDAGSGSTFTVSYPDAAETTR